MKKKLATIILFALVLSALAGFTLGDSGKREHYAGLLREGIITEAEYAKLESYDFALPESEKEPIDDFAIGDIVTGVNTHGVNTHGVSVS